MTKSRRLPIHQTILVIAASIPCFALLLPSAVHRLLFAALPTDLVGSSLWEEWETASIAGLFLLGIPLGLHVGMLLTQRTIRLDCAVWRAVFTFISGFCALVVTMDDLRSGGATSDFPPAFRWASLATVQLLPLLWFAYNLNAGTLQRIVAHRQIRRGIRIS